MLLSTLLRFAPFNLNRKLTMHTEALPVTERQTILRGRLRQLAWISAVTLSLVFWVGLYFLVF